VTQEREDPAFGRGFSLAQRRYVRPAGLLAPGETAASLLAAGDALPLAGGPSHFLAIELLWRGDDNRRQSVTLPLAAARAAAKLAGGATAAWLDERLGVISRPRPAIAGLPDKRPLIMGVVNVTPDSFSDGGRFLDPAAAIGQGRALAAAGADILDIGGESTRPGADPVPPDEEIRRVVPVLEGLRGVAPRSLDSRRAAVMRAGLAAGAGLLNDVTALTGDAESLAVAGGSRVPIVLMHSKGEPKTMQQGPRYDDAALDIYDYLEGRLAACAAAGIAPGRLIADPGIGFGQTLDHIRLVLRDLALFHGLGVPLLVGLSRKSFIGRISGGAGADARLPGSLAGALWCWRNGVQILRVHDVGETRQALAVWQAAADFASPPGHAL
jgi:dihydropteroate synthase